MIVTTLPQERISVEAHTLEEVEEVGRTDLRDSTLVLRLADGEERVLSDTLQQLVVTALKSLAGRGRVTLEQLPEELTSTVAAEILGVSRPTLLKWAKNGEIDSHKVGSHTRFTRDEVFTKKQQRVRDRRAAFSELRALDADFEDALEE